MANEHMTESPRDDKKRDEQQEKPANSSNLQNETFDITEDTKDIEKYVFQDAYQAANCIFDWMKAVIDTNLDAPAGSEADQLMKHFVTPTSRASVMGPLYALFNEESDFTVNDIVDRTRPALVILLFHIAAQDIHCSMLNNMLNFCTFIANVVVAFISLGSTAVYSPVGQKQVFYYAAQREAARIGHILADNAKSIVATALSDASQNTVSGGQSMNQSEYGSECSSPPLNRYQRSLSV